MTQPILIDIPYEIQTERLNIRGPLPGDGERLYTAVKQSQDHLMQWMPWAANIPDATGYEVLARKGQLRFLAREDLWLLLFLKETGALIGSSGLHRIDWDVPKFEIGYWVHVDYVGRGLITEAVAGIINLAFETLGACRLEIRCDAGNERSAAVPRRLGFVHEGTLVGDGRHHLTNALRDTMIFARTRPDET